MSTHIGSLKRLQQKLASTYGEADPLALQFQVEIAAREALAGLNRRRSFTGKWSPVARTASHRREMLCACAS
jgi:hypothetical protein